MDGKIIESIPIKCEEQISEVQDNLNTSLTSLTIDETKETNQNEQFEEKTEKLPTKLTTIPIRVLPTNDVPEKIILCLDTCIDPEYTAFKIESGTTYPPLYMLKRIINIFVQNKNFIDPRHEFALITLEGKDIRWCTEFTNNPMEIINSLKDISECETSDECILNKLLNAIWENVNIPKVTNLSVPPPYVVRVILLFSRSLCSKVPVENYDELLNNPYFTIDVIFTHEETPVEKSQEIFNNLQLLDKKMLSYKFEVGRNSTLIHGCMAKLLSHPLQRPLQNLALYEISQERKKVEKEE